MSELLTLHGLLGKYDGEQSLHQVLKYVNWRTEWKKTLETGEGSGRLL